ncbi:MAG: ASPIC/UnbV domain-containing protein, partial [Acidobacteriaceae bacterium]|nr:ASPIC/UnbV domain-containing protein [Acidobacteriaceae bacterium]
DVRAHFGLGARTTVDDLEIRWPSGIVQHVQNVKADQVLTVKEQQ